MVQLTTGGASEQELEAIRLAIIEIWPELTAESQDNHSPPEDSQWRFSSRRWLEENPAQHLIDPWFSAL